MDQELGRVSFCDFCNCVEVLAIDRLDMFELVGSRGR